MIPRTIFEPEHEQFRESVRKFFESHAVPYHAQWEKDGQIDRALWNKAGEMGFLAPSVPEEYGGMGLDYLYNTVMDEEMAKLGLSGPGFHLQNDITVPYLVKHASEAQKQKYLPKCLSGEMIVAIAMTEPGTGSDLQGVKTTAIADGDEYVINGSKTFITNGQQADLVIVVCKTDPNAGAKGISLLLVEAGTPGFEKGSNLEKIGLKAQDTSELFFQDVRVPKENMLGEEGMGFVYLMQDLPQERLTIAVMATAGMEATLQQTVDYVKERKAFGQPIANFQNTQFKLAQMDAEITAMRVFVDRCIELHVQGKLDAVTASKAKMLASDLQNKVIDECLQLHGGYGYMWEYPVARAFADARIQRIFGGTNEVMKIIISRELLAD
ncbi:acyl-CoA dehydrogenase [Pseudomaricurvus alkylphenolicus]|uniref:acyl-CoA dehydrogenase family protein n=1 Tax=Pseudomaricurvus alkylphenolicus TaxID=1306991 RepID=UPI00141E772B|nr:acyl-CoA dehydrogenase family protein [Pseudomaricurvus alkylphenolicus]NIB44875.1 acyl-CoA dehydrogenase [Pseudomaricurvus alkylphenolicus]